MVFKRKDQRLIRHQWIVLKPLWCHLALNKFRSSQTVQVIALFLFQRLYVLHSYSLDAFTNLGTGLLHLEGPRQTAILLFVKVLRTISIKPTCATRLSAEYAAATSFFSAQEVAKLYVEASNHTVIMQSRWKVDNQIALLAFNTKTMRNMQPKTIPTCAST